MKKLLIFSVILFSVIVCVTSVHAGWLDSLFGNEESQQQSQQKQPQDKLGIEKWVLKEINLEMVKCPAGSFMMGSPENELGRKKDETLHKVTLLKPFYIGIYEVTQSQYVALIQKNPSIFVGANRPVDSVSYFSARAFCGKLNSKYINNLPKGYRFDLPTEAQWEYACRAGTTTSLNNCKNLTEVDESCFNLDEIAWYVKNSGDTTHEVGQKKPNAWGIYDMHGNVTEWCRDSYGEYPERSVIDPTGDEGGSYAVLRGGSYSSYPENCRSGNRNSDTPFCAYTYGFRLALVPID